MAIFLRRVAPLWAVVLLVAAVVFISGCHPKVSDPNDPQFVVAEGSDWNITRAQLDHELDEYLKEQHTSVAQVGASNVPVIESALLKNMVMEKLLVDRANKQNFKDVAKDETEAFTRLKGKFPTDAEFQAKLKQTGITEDELKKRIHEQVLIESLFRAEAVKDPQPTDKEVNDFYLGHKDIFTQAPKLRASRVLIHVDVNATPAVKAQKKKQIEAARARVMKGEEFSKVATEVSEDRNSQPHGGDVGYFQRGENENGFDDVAFASKVGVVSPVFEDELGYQFIKVTESKPAGLLAIDDVRSYIVDNLTKIKVGEQEQAYTQKLMKDANVKYNIKLVEPPPDATTMPGAAPTGADQGAPSAPEDASAPAPAPADSAAPAGTNSAPAPQ